MPLIWRGMRLAEGKPEIGSGGNLLGVRIGPGKGDDILEENGYVQPRTGGMSVSPTVEALPPHRIPRRLRDKKPQQFPDACGSNQLFCWWMGEGLFVPGPVAQDLFFRPDPQNPKNHGFVEPERRMLVGIYEAALAATRDRWKRWEE
jgi:hypothetical protein